MGWKVFIDCSSLFSVESSFVLNSEVLSFKFFEMCNESSSDVLVSLGSSILLLLVQIF